MHALSLLDETTTNGECCQLSVHALAGTESIQTIRLKATVGGQFMLLLVDSGSSHTFVIQSFAERANCTITSAPAVPIRVANGQFLHSDSQVQGLKCSTQGHEFSTDMRILELGAYDAILGVDWLTRFSPMNCHWGEKTLQFQHQGNMIMLQGIVAKEQGVLLELHADQLLQWLDRNEVWALIVVEKSISEEKDLSPLAPDIQTLLHEFSDIFSEPSTWPPRRSLDHAITLQHDAQPVNDRPYRYSPLQKDEIERQVTEMLQTKVVRIAILNRIGAPLIGS